MPGLSTGVESICLLSERGKTSGEHGGEWACVFEHTECEMPGRQFGIRVWSLGKTCELKELF